MKKQAEVFVEQNKVRLEVDGEVIAANYGGSYAPLPSSFIDNGWLYGFPKEVGVEYKTQSLGEVGDYLYLALDKDGFVKVNY